ncbi:MAG: hypothetical protein QOG49_27 [Frankiaceae bacterium]|jgi:hypothetical protein|nr:hypothetical protein [Frankiaceae bacterium]
MSGRPQQPRRVRRRPSLLLELTDEIEPDERISVRRRLIAMLTLVVVVAASAGAVAFVIMQTLSRTH